jgi:hypothetical protein
VSADISKCYELLGVKPGVSPVELKAAYRDMAKVWHPDRFGHDERLQQKAQEKLKEINEAYEFLASGKTPRATSSASAKPRESYTAPNEFRSTYPVTTNTTARPKSFSGHSFLWVVVFFLAFGAVFLVTSRTLLRSAQSRVSQEVSQERQPTESHAANAAEAQRTSDASSRNRNRTESEPSESAVTDVRANEVSATPLQPMKTVSVLIDPATGLLARADCPVKTRVSYPAGTEPHGSCAAVHAKATDESRVKAVAKRVASPGKWLGESKEKSEGDPQD